MSLSQVEKEKLIGFSCLEQRVTEIDSSYPAAFRFQTSDQMVTDETACSGNQDAISLSHCELREYAAIRPTFASVRLPAMRNH
jgi:hypothetical protein